MKNEKLKRKDIIDNRLKQDGWNVTDRTQEIEEFDIIFNSNLVQEAPTPYAGHQYRLAKDRKPLAVVEFRGGISMKDEEMPIAAEPEAKYVNKNVKKSTYKLIL